MRRPEAARPSNKPWPQALAAASLAVALVGLAGCAEKQPAASGAGGGTPIRIGAVLDITGVGASLGDPEQKTLRLLVDQANRKGGIAGHHIELSIEDDQSTEDGAAKAFTKLTSQDRVNVILGASRSGPSLAMAPMAESGRLPMIALAADTKVIAGRKWVFTAAQDSSIVVQDLVDYAAKQGWHRVGLARDSSGFGEGIAGTINRLGKAKGVQVVTEQKFAPTATDLTAQLVNLRDARADVNIIWGIPPAAALAQQEYRRLNITTPVLQSHGIGNSQFLQLAGSSANGLIAPMGRLLVADQLPAGDPQKKVLQAYITSYTGRYGQPPSTFGGHAYDAFQLVQAAVTKAGLDGARIRDYLEHDVKNFSGVSGVFNPSPTDHSGLNKHALAFVTVRDGKWKLLDDNRG